MKTLSFTATEVGGDDDGYALIAGVVREHPYQYVSFQRDAADNAEDWEIHFEFNDQINGKYECIQACSIARDRLFVRLNEPIDCQKQISTIDITLEIADADFVAFVDMLRRIFRGREALLNITANDA